MGQPPHEPTAHLGLAQKAWLRVACILGAFGLMAANATFAAEAIAEPVLARRFPVAQVFTILFLMLGPFKIVGPFAKITQGADAAFTRRLALLSTWFASLALLIAAFLGETLLGSYGIPVPVLALAGGLILFAVAMLHIIQQFAPVGSHTDDAADHGTKPALQLALAPLAFPTIVTPYGIAALIVFLALSPDAQGRLTIGAVVVAIMLLNLAVMIVARHIMPVLGIVLPILGAVLGVVQVAVGLQIINNALRTLGAL
jgi:multiple antibiotic resistance protein